MSDQAVLAYLDREVDALAFGEAVRGLGADWLVDVVQAYASVAVFFTLERANYERVAARLEPLLTASAAAAVAGRLHRIPCCYERQLDLAQVVAHCGIDAEQIIRLHSETIYTVYAIGFCPGFPYLGYLPKELTGVPRRASPRVRVEAGTVGLTGRQTGIYTEPRPGGWNLIGQTPLELVNVADDYFPLRTGDRVQFVRIDEREFNQLNGERLPSSSCRRPDHATASS